MSFRIETAAAAGGEDAMTAMARARFREGVEYYDKGEYEQARAAFLQAYALKKHPAVLLNLAWSCLKSGHVREADQYFRQFLSEGREITDKQRADANEGLAQVHSKLGRIDVAAPAGTDVTIDGEHVGAVPLAEGTYVEPGFHSVVLRAPDGAVETVGVTVAAGEKAIAHLGRQQPSAPSPAASPPAPEAPPAAAPVPPQPAAPPSLPSAPPGATSQPESAPVSARPNEAEGYPGLLAAAITTTGVSVAGFATALGLLIAKNSAQSKANTLGNQITSVSKADHIMPNNCASPANLPQPIASACTTWNSDNSTVNTDATIGNYMVYVVGVGGAVAATTLWIIYATRNRQASPHLAIVAPMIDRSTAGLSISGSF